MPRSCQEARKSLYSDTALLGCIRGRPVYSKSGKVKGWHFAAFGNLDPSKKFDGREANFRDFKDN
jgi:hypothetical protein